MEMHFHYVLFTLQLTDAPLKKTTTKTVSYAATIPFFVPIRGRQKVQQWQHLSQRMGTG